MLICAIDTSGRDGSVALAEGDAGSFRVLDFAPIAGGNYSEQLIAVISAALQSCGRSKSEIKLLVVASGPGSFTGLRVGVSTAKAFAEALDLPIIAISVLEAIAFSAKTSGTVLAALDAQRSEVYVGEYESAIDASGTVRVSRVEEALFTIDAYSASLSARVPVPVTYTPDVAVETKVREAGSPVQLLPRPAADVYARFGLQKYLAGKTVAADTLDANYLRRSDAEIFGIPKSSIPPK